MKTTITKISAQETWPIRHTVMWPDKPLEYVQLEKDAVGKHYGCLAGDTLVAVISLFILNNQAQFRKLATLKEHQGRGYGTQLLKHILKTCQLQGVQKVWCNARKDKLDFYTKHGFQVTDKIFKKGGISFVIIEKYIL